MTEKQIIDKLNSINLSLKQKKDLIDIIKDITANSGGSGGTSTDKEALDIYLNYNDNTVTVNDKKFLISNISEVGIEINNKELYNSLDNVNMPIFIKTSSDDIHISGYATYIRDNVSIQLSLYFPDGGVIIIVYNQ